MKKFRLIGLIPPAQHLAIEHTLAQAAQLRLLTAKRIKQLMPTAETTSSAPPRKQRGSR